MTLLRHSCLLLFHPSWFESERDRHIREYTLVTLPLHLFTLAYQIDKSTEAALHSLVVMTEKALYPNEFAIEAFLDIQGVFDFHNTSFKSICTSLEQWNIFLTVVRRTTEKWHSTSIKYALEWPLAEATFRGEYFLRSCGASCLMGFCVDSIKRRHWTALEPPLSLMLYNPEYAGVILDDKRNWKAH